MPYKDPETRRIKHREYMRKRYAQEPELRRRHRERVKNNEVKYKKQRSRVMDEFRVNGCSICGEKEHCCLEAHHLFPEEKNDNIGTMLANRVSVAKLNKELDKCVCLCSNCHRKLHAGITELTGSIPVPATKKSSTAQR